MPAPATDGFRAVNALDAELAVSEDGAVVRQWDQDAWHVLRQFPDRWGKGYLRVRPRRTRKTVCVHTLVALAFHGPPPPDRPLVEHLDGSRANNHPDNLRWASFGDNLISAYRLGERPRKAPRALHPTDVVRIRKAAGQRDVRQLADEYGVGPQTIRDVLARKTWGHVRDDQPLLF